MAQVTWTIQALDDLTAIAEFHAAGSENYAALLLQEIFDVEQQLANFPASGRIVPEVNTSTFREVIVRGYRIFTHISTMSR